MVVSEVQLPPIAVHIGEDKLEIRLVLAQDSQQSIEAALVDGPVLFRATLLETKALAHGLLRVQQAAEAIDQTMQALALGPIAPVSMTSPREAPSIPTPTIPQEPEEPIQLVNAFATVALELAIAALRDPGARLSRPATIPPEDVETLLLKAFHGKRLIKSKINAALASGNVRIAMDVLQGALDALVERGDIKRVTRESKKGRTYTLYGFGDVPLDEQPLMSTTMDDLMDHLEEPFSLDDLLAKAEEEKITRKDAQFWFNQQMTEGALYQLNQDKYRRVQ